jgi:hypothetical protein
MVVWAFASTVLWFSLTVTSATNITINRRLSQDHSTCNWPIDLSLERDGKYGDHKSKIVEGSLRGRSGNTIIQYMVFRLNAASLGGFAYPWTGLVGMETGGGTQENPDVEVWGPRFGKLGSCRDVVRHPSVYCPKSTGLLSLVKNPLPKSTAVQKCAADDEKFHQVFV